MKKKKAGKKRVVRNVKQYKVDVGYKKEKYIEYAKQAARIQYWLGLLMLTVFNFMIFAVLIPFILILKSTHLLLIIGTLGFVFGLIFNFLIHDIEHLEKKHHRFAALFIPIVAILNIYILISIERFLQGIYYYRNIDIYYTSFVYVVMFLLPYVFSLFKKK